MKEETEYLSVAVGLEDEPENIRERDYGPRVENEENTDNSLVISTLGKSLDIVREHHGNAENTGDKRLNEINKEIRRPVRKYTHSAN